MARARPARQDQKLPRPPTCTAPVRDREVPAADKRAEATYDDADAVLHDDVMIQEHLLAQDKVLESLASKAGARAA